MSCSSPVKSLIRNSYKPLGIDKVVYFGKLDPPNPHTIFEKFPDGSPKYTVIDLPCGQCIECRIKKSRDWALRMCLEAKQWEHNYFVTLTYNDESINKYVKDYVPIYDDNKKIIVDFETGEFAYRDTYPLVKLHVSSFLKRLRARFKYDFDEDNIRFYACGEYGSKNLRPHYHLILFNCHLRDLYPFSKNFRGDIYFRSPLLEDCWNMGFVTVADVSFDSCAYVARYVTKKYTGPQKEYYDLLGIVPEFSLCSRMPGIGRFYFDDNIDKIYNLDSVPVPGKAFAAKPPKYFDKLYKELHPDEFEEISSVRQVMAQKSLENELSQTNLSPEEYMRNKHENFLKSIDKLFRDTV